MPTEIIDKKKKFQPYNLVFLKKKNNPNNSAEAVGEDKEKQSFKVKMPFKMITKNVIK